MEQRQAYLNGKSRRLIYSMLENVLKARVDGTFEYTDGWTDEKVTAHIRTLYPQAELKVGQVTGVRNRGWGSLYKELVQTDAEVIAELKARVHALENAALCSASVDTLFPAVMGYGEDPA